MTATPARPCPLESAKMVSAEPIAGLTTEHYNTDEFGFRVLLTVSRTIPCLVPMHPAKRQSKI